MFMQLIRLCDLKDLIKAFSESAIGAGARVIRKAYPEERVGVFAQRGDAVVVVEYRCVLTELKYCGEFGLEWHVMCLQV